MKPVTLNYITPLTFDGNFLTWRHNITEALPATNSFIPYPRTEAEALRTPHGLDDFVEAGGHFYGYANFTKDTSPPFPGTHQDNLSAISVIKCHMEYEITALITDGDPPRFALSVMKILQQQALKAAKEADTDPEAPSFGDLRDFKLHDIFYMKDFRQRSSELLRIPTVQGKILPNIHSAVTALRNAARDIAPHRPPN
ncbi:hypothetical protein BC829DRAFT_445299 [Chytridium lagenaria]|nr:hypothetical protein BC829DRAFT_445299 [Chytridium lagenaria]